ASAEGPRSHGGSAQSRTQTKSSTAQEEESAVAVPITESQSEERAGGRVRSGSDAERNPGSDLKVEGEEEGRGKGTFAETKEEKETCRRKISHSAQKEVAQTIRNAGGPRECVTAARDRGPESKRTATADPK